VNLAAPLDGCDPAAIAQAAAAWAAGALVAFPTETVYGLGARADDDLAVARIFAAKGRPADHPLIVHVADVAAAAFFCDHWPPLAQRLAAALWPGPLTVIVPRAAGIANACAGGQATIGLRCPAHPVAAALLRAAATLGVPGIAAPSANRFGRLSPTSAAHVVAELGDACLVIDGGPCGLGIESTIVDCSRGGAVLLRPGTLARRDIEAVLGQPLADRDAAAPRAPGTLEAHYAPRAALRLMPAAALQSALQIVVSTQADAAAPGLALAVYSRQPLPPGCVANHRHMPASAAHTAHELFAVLRQFDDDGAQLIWVEAPPSAADWDGVRDRLTRAAAS
jgi:L-threonylcarbamoyladenylate synthase